MSLIKLIKAEKALKKARDNWKNAIKLRHITMDRYFNLDETNIGKKIKYLKIRCILNEKCINTYDKYCEERENNKKIFLDLLRSKKD